MPRQNTSETERTSRRSLLRTVGAGALATVGLGAGVAAAGDASTESNCYYEYQCLELICPYDDDDGNSTEQRRECCEDPDTGEVTCGDWESNGCCSFTA